MRHKMAGAKLGRTTAHRQAMLRNMSTSLFDKERITTTLARAVVQAGGIAAHVCLFSLPGPRTVQVGLGTLRLGCGGMGSTASLGGQLSGPWGFGRAARPFRRAGNPGFQPLFTSG